MRKFLVKPTDRCSLDGDPNDGFPIQNLPFGLLDGGDGSFEAISRIGNHAIRLVPLVETGLLDAEIEEVLGFERNLLHRPTDVLRGWRKRLHAILTDAERLAALRDDAIVPLAEVTLAVPVVKAFVDFYSGIHHASNVGKMFRPDMAPLLPNYRWLPVGYNGRASSVQLSGKPVHRPAGQTMAKDAAAPTFGPTRELDFELEVGFFIGSPVDGPVSVEAAEAHLSGLVLVNDWSARDVQRFEYQPLGPFLAKSFCTSISPWIVTLDALEPFRCVGPTQDPTPLPHLASSGARHFDIHLEVWLKTRGMERADRISQTNFKELYWSPAQQLAHQASNGTPVEPGDLYASGTISGDTPGSFGSLLELTWRGTKPIQLSSGEVRTFLEEGDEVTMVGYCQGDGFRVGFGDVRGVVLG